MRLAELIDDRLMRAFPPFGTRPLLFDLFRFCAVGGLGVFVDSAVLFAVVEAFGIPPAIGVFPAFAVAVSFNYALNRAWTYRSRPRGRALGGYLSFVAICAVGAGLRSGILAGLLSLYASIIAFAIWPVMNSRNLRSRPPSFPAFIT